MSKIGKEALLLKAVLDEDEAEVQGGKRGRSYIIYIVLERTPREVPGAYLRGAYLRGARSLSARRRSSVHNT